jgi:LysM repeat protein
MLSICAGVVLTTAIVGVGFFRNSPSVPSDRANTSNPADSDFGTQVPMEFPADPVLPEQTQVATPQSTPSTYAPITQVLPAPARREALTTYTVLADDVLWRIAEQFSLRTETLVWANDLDSPDLLQVGQSLRIPPADGLMYTVQPGERLADLGQHYGLEPDAIAQANGVSDPNQITAGTELFLPNARPSITVVAAAAGTSVEGAAPPDQAVALTGPAVPLPADVAALLTAGWLRVRSRSVLYRDARDSVRLSDLPEGAAVERIGDVTAGRIQVRDPGDGRTREAMTGWLAATVLDVGRAPPARQLAQAYPADAAMDIAQVFAPYRSQLDGTPYAQANCGPATLGMALDAFGASVSSAQLRTEALAAQGMRGNDVGTLITALARVAEQHGLRAMDLFSSDGDLQRWSLGDIRTHVGQGHPVVVQVRYRALPGRESVAFFGDHYLLITGLVGDRFLYNDAIDADGLGWDRLLTPERLQTAMDASDRRYAFSAFAIGR